MGKSPVAGSVIVVAKCPIPGKSKTRLIPLTGVEGSSHVATAMLADVLTSLTLLEMDKHVDRILLYAPPTEVGRMTMESVLDRYSIPRQETEADESSQEYSDKSSRSSRSSRSRSTRKRAWNPNAWTLLPMSNQKIDEYGRPMEKSDDGINLRGAYLSDILENALIRARLRLGSFKSRGPALFLGMDSPELPLDEVAYALEDRRRARLCPSADGGYGLLSIPFHAPSTKIFQGVRWSDPQTSVSQLKALTDLGIEVSLGKLMYDIDEPADVVDLVERLHKTDHFIEEEDEDEDEDEYGEYERRDRDIPRDVLTAPPPAMTIQQRTTGSCLFTRQALEDLKLWGPREEVLNTKSRTLNIHSMKIVTKPTASSSFSSGDHEHECGSEVILENPASPQSENSHGFFVMNDLAGSASYSL